MCVCVCVDDEDDVCVCVDDDVCVCVDDVCVPCREALQTGGESGGVGGCSVPSDGSGGWSSAEWYGDSGFEHPEGGNLAVDHLPECVPPRTRSASTHT